MATLTGDLDSTQYANAYVSEPSVKNDAADDTGRVRRKYAIYTIPTGDVLDTDAVVRFFRLPKGATLLRAHAVLTQGSATAGIVDIGWDGGTDSGETADPNGMFSALDFGAADVDDDTMLTATCFNRTFADEVTIEGDITELTAGDGGVLELEVEYSLN